jgi:hypothetical protein
MDRFGRWQILWRGRQTEPAIREPLRHCALEAAPPTTQSPAWAPSLPRKKLEHRSSWNSSICTGLSSSNNILLRPIPRDFSLYMKCLHVGRRLRHITPKKTCTNYVAFGALQHAGRSSQPDCSWTFDVVGNIYGSESKLGMVKQRV